jgi:NhaB family Na+:H+ antiporter
VSSFSLSHSHCAVTPLQPGGLLAIEGILLGLADPHSVFHEAEANFEVILLLMFMVAGIYFMKDLLLFVFTKILLNVRSKKLLAFLFSIVSAVLSAFLDALTVTAVLISVGVGFSPYFTGSPRVWTVTDKSHDHTQDSSVQAESEQDLEAFRAFLRSLLMHGAVGTALGGVCTLVGEPQNLLIATVAGWDFQTFFLNMAPITMPVLVCGLLTCVLLEMTGWFGYGALMPENVRQVLTRFDEGQQAAATARSRAKLKVQGGNRSLFWYLRSPFHLAGGRFNRLARHRATDSVQRGSPDEHEIGHAFQEALPFTALLVVFFAIVAVIHEQHLFTPVIESVLAMSSEVRPAMFFLA